MRVESHLKPNLDQLLVVASYGITFVRLVLAAFAALAVINDNDSRFAIISIVLIMALDYFDGATFNRSTFCAVRQWRIKRRIADSVSDRLVIQMICIPLLIRNSSFWIFYLPIIAREVAISGYVSMEYAKGVLLYPRSISKIACAMVGVAVIGFLALRLEVALMITGLMSILSLYTLVEYVRRAKGHTTDERRAADLDEVF